MSFCTSLSTRQRQMTCTPTALDDHCLVFSYGIQVLWMCRLNKTHVLWLRNSRFVESRCWQAIETYYMYNRRLQLVCTTYLNCCMVKTRTETCANMVLLQRVSMPHISHLHVDAISSHQHLNHSMLAINGKDVETFEEAPPGNSSHQQALALQQWRLYWLKFNIRQLQHWTKQIKRN